MAGLDGIEEETGEAGKETGDQKNDGHDDKTRDEVHDRQQDGLDPVDHVMVELFPPGPRIGELREREREPQVEGDGDKGPRRQADDPPDEQDDPFDVLGKPPDGERLEPGPHHIGQVCGQPSVDAADDRECKHEDDGGRNGKANGTEEQLAMRRLVDFLEGLREILNGPIADLIDAFAGQFIDVRRGDEEDPFLADADHHPLGPGHCRNGVRFSPFDEQLDPRLRRLDTLLRGVTEHGSPHGDYRAVLDLEGRRGKRRVTRLFIRLCLGGDLLRRDGGCRP